MGDPPNKSQICATTTKTDTGARFRPVYLLVDGKDCFVAVLVQTMPMLPPPGRPPRQTGIRQIVAYPLKSKNRKVYVLNVLPKTDQLGILFRRIKDVSMIRFTTHLPLVGADRCRCRLLFGFVGPGQETITRYPVSRTRSRP